MDWSNESYVRVYKKKTADHAVLCWQARALWPMLLIEADRAGVLATKHGAKGLAALLQVPREFVDAGLPELMADGCISELADGKGYVIPNYLAAQEATQSDKQRKKDERERRRALAMAAAIGADVTKPDADVTKPDIESQNRTPESQVVTSGHEESRQVTLSSAVQCIGSMSGKPDDFALLPTEPEPEQLHQQLARACCEELNAALGSRYEPDAKETVRCAKARAKDKRTPEQVRAVTRDRIAAWNSDPKMREYLCPSTLLSSKFDKYHEGIAARPLLEFRVSPHTGPPAPPSEQTARMLEAIRKGPPGFDFD